jgi:murein DD-endopeptidase MepM/ murein hydrolase activator NlpD
LLAGRGLIIPVDGIEKGSLYNSFSDGRGARKHEAIDIHAPRGTPVLAAGDGCVVKLFRSIPGGITLYQFDPEGNFAYYYAHLDRYVDDMKEGSLLQQGDVLGYVGTTGNAAANAPHLHFAIFRMGPERRWWKGTPINPYAVFTYP